MDENLDQQFEEIVGRVLKLHARFKVSDPDTYTEAMIHLKHMSVICDDMADSLNDRLREREAAGRN